MSATSASRDMLVSTGTIWQQSCRHMIEGYHSYRLPVVPVTQVNELRSLAKGLVDALDDGADTEKALADLRRAVYGA